MASSLKIEFLDFLYKAKIKAEDELNYHEVVTMTQPTNENDEPHASNAMKVKHDELIGKVGFATTAIEQYIRLHT